MTTKVLLTGGGGAGTIEVIRGMRQSGDFTIVAADANEHSAGFPISDKSYVIPFGVDPAFEGAMRRILADERPQFVVPLVDEEIPIVHRLVAAEFPATRVVGPRLDFSELAMDKWRMAEALHRERLGCPRTWLASDAASATYPAIVKPRAGRGSRGFAELANPADLARYLAAANLSADAYIVQERCDGVEFTTSVVVTLEGTCLAVVPKEVKIKRGITQVGVTRAVPSIDALCRAIADRLGAGGPFNVQLFLGADGVPRVIEVNPRFSTTVALTVAAGINEVEVVIRAAMGQPVGPLSFTPDLMMVRYVSQFYVAESDFAPTDLRAPAKGPAA